MAGTDRIRVGIAPPVDATWWSDRARQDRYLSLAADAGLDHLFIADHVSFRGGSGADGLIQAATLLALQPQLGVQVGVYLLALRHPVLVARQLVTLSEHAPGRLVLGVGVGGEDRREFEVCEVDPTSRGRRTDEALAVLRSLLAGRTVDRRGEFFELRDARVLPAPDPPIPIVIGGRSPAALRRTALHGDGWLAAWTTAERFAGSVAEITELAAGVGRGDVEWQHGYQGWIGIGSGSEARLAGMMERFYQVPFQHFSRHAPCGEPEEMAAHFAPFAEAGARYFNVVPVAETLEASIAGLAEVAGRLRSL